MFKKLKKPYIIAEIGSNHNGNMKICKKMIIEAKKAGSDAVKFQFFSLNNLFSQHYFKNNKLDKNEIIKYSLNEKQLRSIFSICKRFKIDVGFTPFGSDAVKILKKYNPTFYKIASMDCNNYEFIREVALTKKPMISSTGLSKKKEIFQAYSTAKKYSKNFALLHCTSLYPPNDNQVNLKRIQYFNRIFKVPIGFSDHTLGINFTLAAIGIGAKIIEKHFTLDKEMSGWDHSMSIDKNELKDLVINSERIYKGIGRSEIYRVEPLKQIKTFRRSIVAEKDIYKGETFSKLNLSLKRPGSGLEPIHLKKIIGKKSKKKIEKGSLLKLSDF